MQGKTSPSGILIDSVSILFGSNQWTVECGHVWLTRWNQKPNRFVQSAGDLAWDIDIRRLLYKSSQKIVVHYFAWNAGYCPVKRWKSNPEALPWYLRHVKQSDVVDVHVWRWGNCVQDCFCYSTRPKKSGIRLTGRINEWCVYSSRADKPNTDFTACAV